jgi:hypothetical protein
MEKSIDYIVKCWRCMAEFNAMEATFCNHPSPSKICPFCLACLCQAPEEYQQNFWENSPRELLEEKLVMENKANLKLGEILIRAGKITTVQLKDAIEKQKLLRKRLGEIIVMMDLLTPDELELYLIDQKQMDDIELKDLKINVELVERIGIDFCSLNRVIPLEIFTLDNVEVLRLAVTPGVDLSQLKMNERIKEFTVIPYSASPEEIDSVLRTFKGDVDDKDILVLDDESDRKTGPG